MFALSTHNTYPDVILLMENSISSGHETAATCSMQHGGAGGREEVFMIESIDG